MTSHGELATVIGCTTLSRERPRVDTYLTMTSHVFNNNICVIIHITNIMEYPYNQRLVKPDVRVDQEAIYHRHSTQIRNV